MDFATFARHRLFADALVATRAANRLRALPRCPQARVLAWALLPDRWLGLIETMTTAALARQVDRLKAALALGPLGDAHAEPVRATAFHTRLAHDDRNMAEVAREILDEPVRVGLA